MQNLGFLAAYRILAVVAAYFVLTLAATASAEEPTEETADFTRSGGYLGIGLAGGLPAFDGDKQFTITTPSSGDVTEDPGVGLNFRAGWRFASWAATEIQYEWLSPFNINTRGEECAEVQAQVLTGNLKLFAPYHAFHPYALAGVGTARYARKADTIAIGNNACFPNGARSKQRDWELAARFGMGFDLYLTNHWVINLEGTGVYSNDGLLDTSWPFYSIGAGIQYRF